MMKNIVKWLLFAFVVTFVSCEDDTNVSQYSGDQNRKVEETDSANNKEVNELTIDVEDTNGSLETKLTTLTTEVSTLKQQVKALEAKVVRSKEENSSQAAIAVMCIVLILVDVFLFFLFRYMLKKTENALNEQTKLIGTNQKKLAESAAQELEKYSASHVGTHKELITYVDNHLKNIYAQLHGNNRTPIVGQENLRGESDTRTSKPPRQSKKKCYFGMIKAGGGIAFFNDICDYKNDDTFFEMETTDGKVCTFKPFDIQRLKPLDVLEEAVEYDGCPLQEAKTILKTQQPGMAEYQPNGDYWRITRKAIITIG